jgi:hypothetical protein
LGEHDYHYPTTPNDNDNHAPLKQQIIMIIMPPKTTNNNDNHAPLKTTNNNDNYAPLKQQMIMIIMLPMIIINICCFRGA